MSELVQRLRDIAANYTDFLLSEKINATKEAADALEAQQRQIERLRGEREELEIDAQFGRIAMQFVDRAGDYCDTDPASRICDEFHAAFCAQIDANEEKIRARMAGEVKP